MKKILIILFISLSMGSCYKDYIKDYDYSGVYFTYQRDVRTLVVGEGMEIKIGVTLGGVMNNTRDRIIDFQIDPSLITPEILAAMKTSGELYIKNATASVTALSMLPSNYYTLSDNNKMIIKSTQHTGSVVLKADSTAFLTDVATINPTYAIPLIITNADADSIIEPKKYTVIGLKYENMLFGNYWHGGVTIVKNDATNAIVKTVPYYTTIPVPETKIWALKTKAPNVLLTNGISDKTGSMQLTLNGGNITISRDPASTVIVMPDGSSTYNQAKLLQNRKIILNYKYTNGDGTTSYANDTLTFRNRIRDGVNEWQDQNPANY